MITGKYYLERNICGWPVAKILLLGVEDSKEKASLRCKASFIHKR
jgi:hypothetical protein